MNKSARPDFVKLKPLTLYGYEGSPFVRPVRETLGTLALAHKVVYCARGSQNRNVLYEKTGRFQVPYIEDPNTGVNMFESGEIVKYLLATYTI
jgi:glutathione S-transferase